MQVKFTAVTCLLILVSAVPLMAQVATGSYPYGTYQNLGFDTIDVGNLNDHFSIPLLNKAGRGLPFYYNLSYDSSVWYPERVNGSLVWTPAQNFGWRGDTEITMGYVSFNVMTANGRIRGSGDLWYTCPTTTYSQFVYHDTFGVSHPFAAAFTADTSQQVSECNPPPSQPSYTGVATDGSGYTLNITHFDEAQLTSPTGKNTTPPSLPTGSGFVVDSNGNAISVTSAGVFTDTVGTQVLSVSGGAPNPRTFTYTDTQGHQQTVTMNYAAYTVQTDFGCGGTDEYGPTQNYLVSSIVFPDGSTYSFQYEPTPNAPGSVTGRIASVTLPQGGVITYGYSGGSNGIECGDGSTAGLTRGTAATGGSAATSWAYSRATGSGTSQTTVTDGLGNQSVYNFVEASNQPVGIAAQYYQTSRSSYQGSAAGTPLLAVATCYNAESQPCTTTQFSLPISQIDTYNTLNGLEENGSRANYNSYGSQTDEYSYDYAASGQRGALLRHEVWSYNGSLPGLATNDEVFDGSGNEVSDTSYTYDSQAPNQSDGVPQHYSVSGPRGDLDKVTEYTGTSEVSVTAVYDDTGDLQSLTTPNGTSTNLYDSTDTFVTSATPPTPSSGVSLTAWAGYDANTGMTTSTTDANNNKTSYGYDSMLRLNQINYPDGGETTYSYTPTEATVDRYQSAAVYSETDAQLDAYGRQSRLEQSDGQSGNPWYQQDVCYDADGRLAFQSYRYQGSGFTAAKVCSGSGDNYSYDALGRITQVAHANGTHVSYTYDGRATETIDEGGVARISQVDGLGRTTAVCEVSSDSTMPGSGSPASCGFDIAATGFRTTYTYSLAAHTTAVQQGSQTRTFQTDWIGRPISIMEPESGLTTYSYTYNGTGLVVTRVRPEANQTNPGITTTTSYQYDDVGRLVSIGYNDGTPAKDYYYDTSTPWESFSQSNLKGRLAMMTAPISATQWTGSQFSYDAMGRVTGLDECLPFGCGNGADDKHISYTYDWVGNTLSAGDGSGTSDSYTYSSANEVLSITSSLSDATHPADLVSNVQNGPFGPLSWNLGNGLTVARYYDGVGNLSSGWVCIGSSQVNCSGGTMVYGFDTTFAGSRLMAMCDSALDQCANIGHDDFGRLKSFDVTAGNPGSFSYIYDRWGNRWDQNAGNGGPSPQLAFNTTTNQISTSGYSYDAAGNMTSDGVHTYSYDADGNVTTVDGGNSAVFAYNALNQRVQVSSPGQNPLDYVFNIAGQRTSIWDTTGRLIQGQTYWGSTPVEYYAEGYAQFEHQDWLGTERVTTNYTGAVEGTFQSLPFGDAYAASGADNDPYHFAALDHDYSSYTDHAQFREYSPMAGRWMSPDPYSGSYDVANPQSMNRYAYVLNNPLSYVDPLGLVLWYDPASGCIYNGGVSQGNGSYAVSTTLVSCDGPGPSDPSGGGYFTYGGGGGGGGGGRGSAPSNISTCTISNGRTTAPSPGQAPGPGAFGFVPPAGSVAIDPMALGLPPGAETNGLLGPNASQITFTFSPAPNLPPGFPATHTLGSIVGGPNSRIGGAYFNGLYDFDIFGLPSSGAAAAATSPWLSFVTVTVTYPSSLPISCDGPSADSPLTPPGPSSPGPVPAVIGRPQ